MPRRSRFSAPIVFWPLLAGAGALAGWLVRRWGFGVHHVVRERVHVPEPPAPDPDIVEAPDVQTEDDGVGARFHRRYAVEIAGATASPEEVIAAVASDLDAFCPPEVARFERAEGASGPLAVGDDLHVHIHAPWDGPVRVAEVTPTSFTLVTREGHLEAGQIRFSATRGAAHPEHGDLLRFAIESWARSADGLVDFVYDTLGVAKTAQGAMWTFFCARVAERFGEQVGDVEVLTEREADPDEQADA